MLALEDDHYCFVCGKDNPIGLKLDFKIEGRIMTAFFTPKKEHQGFKDIVHGGIIGAVLDEMMTRLGYRLGLGTVTASFKVDLIKPAIVGQQYSLMGKIVKEEVRKVFAQSEMRDKDNNLIAKAEGLLVKVRE